MDVHIGEFKSFPIDLQKFLSHYGMVTNCRDLLLNKSYFQTLLLHLFYYIKLSVLFL